MYVYVRVCACVDKDYRSYRKPYTVTRSYVHTYIQNEFIS